MRKIIIAGIGTEIGKTIVSAIVVEALQGTYWKPIQTGNEEDLDSATVHSLVSSTVKIHPEAYCLRGRFSPHHAARLENTLIDPSLIKLPVCSAPLVIESCGGLLVPLNDTTLQMDLLSQWDAEWILVSKNYLGSINHTLLSCELLRARGVPVRGIIFNGTEYPEGEQAILKHSGFSCIARLLPEPEINKSTIQRYASKWKQHFLS